MGINRGINPWNSSIPSPDLVPQYRGQWAAVPYEQCDVVVFQTGMYIAKERTLASEKPQESNKWFELVNVGRLTDMYSSKYDELDTSFKEYQELNSLLNEKVDALEGLAGIKSLGRPPTTGDTAGIYRFNGEDITWDGSAIVVKTDAISLAKNNQKVIRVNARGYPHDDTTIFQAALEEAKTTGVNRVYIPSAPDNAFDTSAPQEEQIPHYICGELTLFDNLEIFGDGKYKTIIRTLPTQSKALLGVMSASEQDQVFGVRIHDLMLWGRSEDHTEDYSAAYEHNHLVNVNGVNDFEISDVHFRGSVGDAIYIGGGFTSQDVRHNSDVRIINCSGDGVNWFNRNWLTVITVDGLYVKNPNVVRWAAGGLKTSDNTFATYNAPGAIDFEPNHAHEYVRNILVEGGSLQACGTPGIIAVALSRSPNDYAKRIENITIRNIILENTSTNGERRTQGFVLFSNGVTADYNMNISVDVIVKNCLSPFRTAGLNGVTIRCKAYGCVAPVILGGESSTNYSLNTNITLLIKNDGQQQYSALSMYYVDTAKLDIEAFGYVTAIAGANDSESKYIEIVGNKGDGSTYVARLDGNHTTDKNKNKLVFKPNVSQAQITGTTFKYSTSIYPISGLPLNTLASAKPSAYPTGYSITVINGDVINGWPSPLGLVETMISPQYADSGLGFAYQMFTDRQTNTQWRRVTLNPDDANTDWGEWAKLISVNPELNTNLHVPPILSTDPIAIRDAHNDLLYRLHAAGILKVI